MVDRVLQHAGNRAVVLGRDEQQALRRGDFALEPLDLRRLVAVVVLVVERQVVDAQMLESEIRRGQVRERQGQLLVVGFLAKAPDDDCDPGPGHGCNSMK